MQKGFYKFDLPDDFQKGDCNNCHLCQTVYTDYDDDGYIECDINIRCALGFSYKECPIEIISSIFGESRSFTKEEAKIYNADLQRIFKEGKFTGEKLEL